MIVATVFEVWRSTRISVGGGGARKAHLLHLLGTKCYRFSVQRCVAIKLRAIDTTVTKEARLVNTHFHFGFLSRPTQQTDLKGKWQMNGAKKKTLFSRCDSGIGLNDMTYMTLCKKYILESVSIL